MKFEFYITGYQIQLLWFYQFITTRGCMCWSEAKQVKIKY